MKSGRIFWGVFFLTVGVLVLLDNFVGMQIEWSFLWKLWPVALILIGISTLLKDQRFKWMITGSVALLVGVLIFSGANSGCSRAQSFFEQDFTDNGTVITEEFTTHADSTISSAELILEGGAGRYRIGGKTDDLLHATSKSSIGPYTLKQSRDNGHVTLTLSIDDKKFDWQGGTPKNRVDVAMSKVVPWSFDISIGAAALDLNLADYMVSQLNIDAGAADIEATLGDLSDETWVSVEAGASSIDFNIPESVGCEINVDVGLTSEEFTGFTRIDEHTYRTSNFKTAKKKIHMEFDAGISSIKVRRYTKLPAELDTLEAESEIDTTSETEVMF
ncbi:MAG: hypothetical protein CL946_12870 [Ectothiorhodospiraceae bacterium]|nr:hypothetical protein [Ectothiorhodospiraceae bacterium]